MLEHILIAVAIVSLISLAGVFLLFLRRKSLSFLLPLLVPFSAGVLIATALLDLLVEALEEAVATQIFLYVIAGILIFYVLEKFIHWHHHHVHKGKEEHAFTYLNLIGDAAHNFIDGAIIAASFMSNFSLGIVTTIAIIAHEIPQEISDFGLLLYGKMKPGKALMYNFLSAAFAFVGAFAAYFLLGAVTNYLPILLAFAAGSFIYIAMADIVPEMQREKDPQRSAFQFVMILAGIATILGILNAFGH